jgi:hypothetical protein
MYGKQAVKSKAAGSSLEAGERLQGEVGYM